MLQINSKQSISINQLVRVWPKELADGTTEADLLSDLGRYFKDGHLDHSGYIYRGTGRVPVPTHPELWRYLGPLGDRIFLSKKVVKDFARYCNRIPPSWCSDVTNGQSQPSRPSQPLTPAAAATPSLDTTNCLSQASRSPEHLPRAPEAMIKEEIKFEYQRAGAAGEKPPNVKEVPPPVQRKLQQKGYWASKRQIQKRAEDPEFQCLRLPPGKRWSTPGKK